MVAAEVSRPVTMATIWIDPSKYHLPRRRARAPERIGGFRASRERGAVAADAARAREPRERRMAREPEEVEEEDGRRWKSMGC